jgi:hypothetical protein
VADRARGCEGKVGGISRTGQADDRERPARRQQLGHARERRGRVHVVEGGDRRDVVEGPWRERMGHEVADEVVDPLAVVRAPRHVDARGVAVDGRDLRDDAPQVARQHAHAAADVGAAPGAVRDGGEDHPVVVEIVVPPRRARAHHFHDLTALRLLIDRKGS